MNDAPACTCPDGAWRVGCPVHKGAAGSARVASLARERMSALAREIGERIEALLPPRIGFALSLFTTEPGTQWVGWVSTGSPADTIRILREQADRLEHGTSNTAGDA